MSEIMSQEAQGRESAGPRLLNAGFAALLTANVCFGYAFSSFLLLPKFMDVELSAGPASVGAIAAVHGVVIVFLLPFIGAAVDHYGRRRFMVAGALLMAAASAGYAGVGEVGFLLYALRTLQAVAFAMVFAAGGALSVDLAPPERLGQAIGIYGLSFLSMNAIAPAIVEQIARSSGWAIAFATSVCGALLCAALVARIPGSRRAHDPAVAGEGLLAVALRREQAPSLVVIALVGSGLSAVFSFYQLFAIELGISEVSTFLVAYAGAAVVLRIGFGHLIDRWGHRRVATGVLFLYIATLYAISDLAFFGLPLLGASLGAAHGIFYPSFNAVVVADVAAGERGKVMALFQAAFQVGMAGGGLGFGLVARELGYPAVFRGAALAVTLALAILLVTRRSGGSSTGHAVRS